MKRWIVVLVAALALVGCAKPVPGEVTDRDKDCVAGDDGLCTYQLKTEEWFETTNDVYERCEVGEIYPACGTAPD